MNTDNDSQIIESWTSNARSWTTAIRQGRIGSRLRVTNQAIVDAVLNQHPTTVLDIGCGEGWLAHRLAATGVAVTGIDAIAELVETARSSGPGRFQQLTYESLAEGLETTHLDLAVCNFSLIGEDSVTNVFNAMHRLLNPGGVFLVQTLHPLMACGDLPYRDGWRPGSWSGCGEGFKDPPPWYFRTLGSWVQLFGAHDFQLKEVIEPLDPESEQPASIIFLANRAN
ncbi:MAG: class I SAM-dependent methyltransferase [Gammaproteobacteria bacterium]|nr:class I SAM-dependent methyltransferase [Gammaproteobacteria bacterium]